MSPQINAHHREADFIVASFDRYWGRSSGLAQVMNNGTVHPISENILGSSNIMINTFSAFAVATIHTHH